MGLINKGSILGVLVTFAAAILLGLVAFDVPYFKSVFFLRAGIPVNGQTYTVDFGVLGFCGFFPGGPVNCTSPHVGYEIGEHDNAYSCPAGHLLNLRID